MPRYEIHSCEQMIELIQQLGFLPLLASGISGYSAEEMADEECRYIVFPDTETSVRKTVKTIQAHPLIPKDVTVRGFIIDSVTGKLQEIK